MKHSAQRGLALLVVLWGMILLSLVAASFARTTRTEIDLTRNRVSNAKTEALADAGVYLAILALLETDATKRPRADGTAYRVSFGGAEIALSVQDEDGKIDLNAAPDELLRGLFVALGVGADEASALVDAIADFRDADDLHRLNGAEDRHYEEAGLPWGAKDAPFEVVEELQQVLGMTPALYRQVAPALTVYSRRREIDPAVAPRLVLLALPGVQTAQVYALLDMRNQPGQDSSTGPDTEDDTNESGAVSQPRRNFGDGFEGSTELFRRAQEAQDGAEGTERDDSGEPATGSISLTGVEQYLSRSRGDVFSLWAEAHVSGGAVFVREAVVRLKRAGNQPFIFQVWQRGTRTLSDTVGE